MTVLADELPAGFKYAHVTGCTLSDRHRGQCAYELCNAGFDTIVRVESMGNKTLWHPVCELRKGHKGFHEANSHLAVLRWDWKVWIA